MKNVNYLFLLLLLLSCGQENSTQKNKLKLTKVSIEYPAHFPQAKYKFDKYPLTKEGIELGKMLFYDPILSGDSTISCASCHLQKNAFADFNKNFSEGVNGKLSQRNTTALFNLVFYPYFFADGGVTHFEFIALAPMDNDREMDSDLKEIIEKLNKNFSYKKRFDLVFGEGKINTQKLLYAISQFLATLISADSPYDQYLQGDKTALSKKALKGLKIFEQKCQSCHVPPLFTDFSFRNIGSEEVSEDIGRMRITEQETDRGKFKVPSLRNVTLTAPYMQDGSFKNLEEVLEFYNSGTKDTPNLDPFLKKNEQLGIPLDEEEKQFLLAFLKSLEDTNFVNNSTFSSPF